jgi:hypothetical protein
VGCGVEQFEGLSLEFELMVTNSNPKLKQFIEEYRMHRLLVLLLAVCALAFATAALAGNTAGRKEGYPNVKQSETIGKTFTAQDDLEARTLRWEPAQIVTGTTYKHVSNIFIRGKWYARVAVDAQIYFIRLEDVGRSGAS